MAPKKNEIRIALAAGGTGGHIMPALATADALRHLDHPARVDFFCGNRPGERRIYAAAGVEPCVLPLGPMTAGGPVRRIRQLFTLISGLFQAVRLIGRYDAVAGMGGYVAGPVLMAAWLRGVPFVVHDSNTILGRVNRWMGRRAKAIACGLPLAKTPPKIDPRKVIQLGTPVRPVIGRCHREEAARAMGVRSDAFTLFLNGGSLGGSRTYAAVLIGALPILRQRWNDPRPLQVIWATGPTNLENIRAAMAEKNFTENLHLFPTIEHMEHPYALADLIIGRAGGSSIAEILNCGLPSILFPLPISAERHQYYNADVLARTGAAIVCADDKTTSEELAGIIADLSVNPDRLRNMAEAAHRLAHPDAARDLALLIERIAEKKY